MILYYPCKRQVAEKGLINAVNVLDQFYKPKKTKQIFSKAFYLKSVFVNKSQKLYSQWQ